MGNILNPNTPENNLEQVQSRRLPSLGNVVASAEPSISDVVPQVQPGELPPTEPVPETPPPSPPVVEDPVVEPEPTVPEEEVPVEQQQQEQMMQQQGQARPAPYSEESPMFQQGVPPTEPPRDAPSQTGDIITAPTLEPIYNRSESTQRKAQPQELIEAFDSIQVPNIPFAQVPTTDRNLVMSRVQALKEANKNIVQQNRLGLQDFQVRPGGGERVFSTSAIDNALAGTGLSSIIGTTLQDNLDPSMLANNTNTLLSWLESAAGVLKQSKGLAQGVFGWLFSKPFDNKVIKGLVENSPFPEIERRGKNFINDLENFEQEGWRQSVAPIAQQISPSSTPMTEGGRMTLERYGTVFDPAKGYWGDYGNHPLLSPALYVLNLPENILMGMVYDTADALGFDKAKSWDDRTRTLAAIAGRDWGVSNRWSDERYISLQEPEGTVAGDRTGNPYWDAPENLSKLLGISEKGEGSKYIHTALQTVPAMIGELVTGGVSDTFFVGAALDKISSVNVDDVRRLIGQDPKISRIIKENMVGTDIYDEALTSPSLPTYRVPDVTEDAVKVKTFDVDAEGDIVEVAVELELQEATSAADSKPMGQVVDYKDLPYGRRVSDSVREVAEPKPYKIPEVDVLKTDESTGYRVLSSEELTRRRLNEAEATWLAKKQDIVPPTFNRTLNEHEVAELRRQFGRVYDGYTTMKPNLSEATHIVMPDGSLRRIGDAVTDPDIGRVLSDPWALPSSDELVKLQREIDDLTKQLNVSPDTAKASKLQQLIKKRNRANLRHAAEPMESAYTTRLLEGSLPSTQESFSTTASRVGESVIEIERTLDTQRVVIDQLTEELDDIKTVRNQIEETLPTLKPVGRQDIEDALGTYQEYNTFGDEVPELGYKMFEPTEPQLTEGTRYWDVERNDYVYMENTPPTKFAEEVGGEMTLWYHGTSSDIPIQQVDLVKGATPSEYGLGVYLTKSEDVAEQAAHALPQINRPPRPDSIDTFPVRHTIDTSKITKIVNLDAPMPKDIDDLFYNTTVSIFGSNVADDAFRQSTRNVKLRKAWDSVRESVFNASGSPASEKQIREFQQSILEGLRKLQVDAAVLKHPDNPVMVVYNPKLLTPVGVPETLTPPTYLKQYEARSWLDKLTRDTEPTNTNIHNAAQSSLDYAEQATREVAEDLSVELDKQRKLFNEYITSKDKLETIVRKEKQEIVEQLEKTGDTKEAVMGVVRNDLATDAKVRRQRSRQSTQAKDYTKPASQRGKKPPVVPDKPIQPDVVTEPVGVPLEKTPVISKTGKGKMTEAVAGGSWHGRQFPVKDVDSVMMDGKNVVDRQDAWLIKHSEAKLSDGSPANLSYVENTYVNIENYKKIQQGKRPNIGDMTGAEPFIEWVPSTKSYEDYTSWEDYINKFSPEKYNTSPSKVTSKVKHTRTDKVVDDLLKDWDTNLDDVRSADAQAKLFVKPELDNPCL